MLQTKTMRVTARTVNEFIVPAFEDTVVISLFGYETDPVDEGQAVSIQGTLFLIKEVTWVARNQRVPLPHYNLLITPLRYYTSEPETELGIDAAVLDEGDVVEAGSYALFY